MIPSTRLSLQRGRCGLEARVARHVPWNTRPWDLLLAQVRPVSMAEFWLVARGDAQSKQPCSHRGEAEFVAGRSKREDTSGHSLF